MDDLKEIYERIKFLRGKGVKMKEIADQPLAFEINPDNMEIVSIIIDRTNGEILNADMVKPVAGTVSGVEDNRKDGSNFKATSREGGIMITTEKPVGISIYGIGGTLMSRTYVDGTAEFELPAGYYIVKSESDTTSVQKVMAK